MKLAFWHLRVKLLTCFLGGRAVSCRRFAFHTHSEQRARASRDQKLHLAFDIVGFVFGHMAFTTIFGHLFELPHNIC